MRSMLLAIVCLSSGLAVAQGTKQDEAAIRAIIQEEITSWNAGDAKTYSRHFAADGTFTNIRGEFYRGHKDFLERHEAIFRSFFKGSKLKQEIVSLKFVRPDLAVVETLSEVTGYNNLGLGTAADTAGRLRTRLLQVMAKSGDDWQIIAYHNTDIKAPPTGR